MNTLGVVGIDLFLNISPKIKTNLGFKSGEYGNLCRVTLAANRRLEKRFFNHANDFLRCMGWNRFAGTTGGP